MAPVTRSQTEAQRQVQAQSQITVQSRPPSSGSQSPGKVQKSYQARRKVRSPPRPSTPSKSRAPDRESTPSTIHSSSQSTPHTPEFALKVTDMTRDDSMDADADLQRASDGYDSEQDTSTFSIDTPSKTRINGLDVARGGLARFEDHPSGSRVGRPGSASTPDRENNETWHYDEELRDTLLNEARKQHTGSPSKAKSTEGYVYVFQAQDKTPPEHVGPSIVKVGFSARPKTRLNSLNSKCRMKLKQVVNQEQKVLLQARIAEKLALRELAPWGYDFDCTCRTKHGEFFEVTEKKALEVVQRWTAFCRRNPWDENGNLKAFWVNRMEACNIKWKPKGIDMSDNRWEGFTQPKYWEEPWFDLCTSFKGLVDEFPQVCGLLQINRWQLLYFGQGIRMMLDSETASNALMIWMTIGCFMLMVDSLKAGSFRANKFKCI